jgi:hypothetical protein
MGVRTVPEGQTVAGPFDGVECTHLPQIACAESVLICREVVRSR